MRKAAFFFLLLANVVLAACQSMAQKPSYNFDFEQVADGDALGWVGNGNKDYRRSLDSVITKSGNYSAVLEFIGEQPSFGTWTFVLPENYPGKKITFSGYIKTENVEGYAGLWMRIDPQIAFNNMHQEKILGTTDWKRYEFTLDMAPERTDQIVLGALLSGKGKMWLDGLTVTIDGKDIALVAPLEKPAAKQDTAFDRGSAINLSDLNGKQVQNLKALGLIWGFVKYYHPAVASGAVNWDYELFRVLPSVLQAPDQGTRDAVLVKWINKLGPLEKGNAAPTKAKGEPDLGWILTMDFSDALTTLLQDIRSAKRTNEHFYIGMAPGVGNPVFKNESAYYAMEAADDGMRLLALYRYWNMIQYFFPYKNLIEEDWKDVLDEFIPKFTEVDNTEDYVLTLLELIGRIHDTHANIGGNSVLDKFFGERYAPIEVYFVEEQAVVTGYAHAEWGKATDLEVGDVIAAINGKIVANRIQELLMYTPASNYPAKLRDLGPKLLRSNDSTIRVEVLRDGNRLSRVLKTYKRSELTLSNPFRTRDTSFRMIGDSIAYINNGSLNPKDLRWCWDRLKHSKGLIIDDRNYPSHFLVYELSKYLMPRPTPFVVFSVGSVLHPGYFVLNKQMSVGAFSDKRYDGKVVILVNEVSQSSAEFHAMAYRVHPNAVVMGSTTAGADGNISPIILPGGIRTAISGIGVYYPDGGETQRVGIIPDIEVKPTIEGIKEGRDEVLTKAIEWINGQ